MSLNEEVIFKQVEELFHVMPPGSVPHGRVEFKACMPVDKDCQPMWLKITIQGVKHTAALLALRQKHVAHEPGDPDMSASQHGTIHISECRSKNTVLAHCLSTDCSEGDRKLWYVLCWACCAVCIAFALTAKGTHSPLSKSASSVL